MTIPKNTGPFQVGCIDILTKADDIPNDFHPSTLSKLKLGSLVRLFYPCTNKTDLSKNVSTNQVKWIPEPHQKLYGYSLAGQANVKLPGFNWMIFKIAKNILCNAFYNCPLITQKKWQENQTSKYLKEKPKLPVILFSHGLKGTRGMYTVFCTQLASQGYVVAAIEHRDASGSASFIYDDKNEPIEIPYYVLNEGGGKAEEMKLRNVQLHQRVNEVNDAVTLISSLNKHPSTINNLLQTDFDINTFRDRLDTDSIVMMGHSFGGATATKALKEITQLKCGFGLDVWFEPVEEEFYNNFNESNQKSNFLITTQYFNWKKNLAMFYKYKNAQPKKEFVQQVTLKGAVHYDQCDIPAVVPSFLKSYFNKSFDYRIEFNEAVECQRNTITEYLDKFHQVGDNEAVNLLDKGYTLNDHYIEGSNIVLDEQQNADTAKL